ncbi:MAG: hypothetical protein J7494_08170 [Sphingobium sp.]|nr:hypothetical protein [Sphingobium sp.]
MAQAGVGRAGSALLSLLLLGAIVYELRHVDLGRTWLTLPASPLFWIAFALYFWGSPFIEWLILRRLWGAPFSGFGATLRKMVYNEMVLTYLGDAYFFAWLKRTLPHVQNPFVVAKDMAIVSAFMGSLTTILAIALVWPVFLSADRSGLDTPLLLCLALALASGGLIALFRKTLLGLARGEIMWIGGLFGLRIVGQAACAVVMWWSLLPEVGIATWLMLSVVRLVSTRLPLVPSKDLAFAALAVVLVGPQSTVAPMIVHVTGLVLLANIALGAALSLTSGAALLSRRRLAAA